MAKTETLFCLSRFSFIPSIRVKTSAMPITFTLVQSVIFGLDLFLNLKIQSLHILAEQILLWLCLSYTCLQRKLFPENFEFVSWLVYYCSPQQRSSPPWPLSILIVTFIYLIAPNSHSSYFASLPKTFTCLLTQGNLSSSLIQTLVPVHSWWYLYSLRSPLWSHLFP